MTWKMKVEEIEGVLEKVWDLHDKLSDAIHSISRTHFLRSINSSSLRTNSDDNRTGSVFVKGFPVNDCAIRDAKSLNSIRTALENLQDQLEFVHTVQIQQRAERGVAIARLEQSRIVLALRLGNTKERTIKLLMKLELLWKLYMMLPTLLLLAMFVVQQHVHLVRIVYLKM